MTNKIKKPTPLQYLQAAITLEALAHQERTEHEDETSAKLFEQAAEKLRAKAFVDEIARQVIRKR